MNARIRMGVVAVAMVASAACSWAQSIALDLTNSTWGGSNQFYSGVVGGGILTTTNSLGLSTAYVGTSTGSTEFGLGFLGTYSGITPITSDYNLSAGQGLSAGTSLHLVFNNVNSAPDYVAYTGGTLTGLSYNATAHTLTIDTSTAAAAVSTSNPSGVLSSVFGLLIHHSDAGVNYQGTVFQTNLFWDDIMPTQAGYPGNMPAAGLNVNGLDGNSVTFNAYLPFAFLQSVGINQPSDADAIVQKASGTLPITITRTVVTTDGVNPPTFTGGGYTFDPTHSTFDFNGDGSTDSYAIATFSNSVWSTGNMGITAVPEPSTYVAAFGAMALIAALRRRVVTRANLR